MSSLCVLTHRFEPDRPRNSEVGLLVCRGCLARLEQALAEFPSQFEALGRVSASGSAGPRVSGSPEPRLPINPACAEFRADLLWKLVSWVKMIAEERGISEPVSNEIGGIAGWLLVHLRWAAAQMWVDAYANELVGYLGTDGRWVAGLRNRAYSLLYPAGRRRVEVGPCIEAGCPGVLIATVTRTDDTLPPSVDCSEDGSHSWSPGQWPTLGRRLHGAQGYEERAARAFLEIVGRAS